MLHTFLVSWLVTSHFEEVILYLFTCQFEKVILYLFLGIQWCGSTQFADPHNFAPVSDPVFIILDPDPDPDPDSDPDPA